MTNILCIFIYSCLAAVSFVLLLDTLHRGRTQSAKRQDIFYKVHPLFYAALLGWQICDMLFYVFSDPFWVRYLFDLKMVFVALVAVAIFFSVSTFYRLQSVLPGWLPYAVCVVPIITSILAVTSPMHSLFLESYEVVSTHPLTILERSRGIWYYVHLVYSQALVLLTAALVIWKYRGIPRIHRRGSGLLLLALIIYIAFAATETMGIFASPLDYTLIGTVMCGFLFHLATISGGHSDFFFISKKDVFNSLDNIIFILDDNGFVADFNETAEHYFMSRYRPAGGKGASVDFDVMLSKMRQDGMLAMKSYPQDNTEDIFIVGESYPVVFNARRQTVSVESGRPPRGRKSERSKQSGRESGGFKAGSFLADTRPDPKAGNSKSNTRVVGSFLLGSDVTEDRMYVERLKGLAGVDPLTGLINRYSHIERLRQLDRPDNLPVSVIACRISSLREINVNYGITMGNQSLRGLASVLKQCCPDSGYAARLGGNEFLLLVSGCTEAEASRLTDRLNDELLRLPNRVPELAVSFAAATKDRPSQNINQLISDAVARIYAGG